MVKKLLILAIIAELGLFWYVHQETKPYYVTDAPQRQVNNEMLKPKPTDDAVQAVEASTTSSPLEEIKAKYEVEFEKLETETKKKAKELLKKATADFVEESADGIAVLQVMGTYYNEFKAIEKETDEAFNKLYKQLEEELELSGYSKDEAIEYKKMYEEKKKQLLKKALDVQGSYE